MADYDGRLLFSLEDGEIQVMIMPQVESIIFEEDSEDFVDSYTPSEGCPEA